LVDEVGKHSAVSAFERVGRMVIVDKDLSGMVIVDDGIVLKIAGVVHLWFKPDPKSENDFKGAVLALPLGKVGKVDAMLADGTKTTDVEATLRGISVEGRRFDRMPRMSGTMGELGQRLQVFVDMGKSGFPSYAKERKYFSRRMARFPFRRSSTRFSSTWTGRFRSNFTLFIIIKKGSCPTACMRLRSPIQPKALLLRRQQGSSTWAQSALASCVSPAATSRGYMGGSGVA
jgi:hypothetical protein